MRDVGRDGEAEDTSEQRPETPSRGHYSQGVVRGLEAFGAQRPYQLQSSPDVADRRRVPDHLSWLLATRTLCRSLRLVARQRPRAGKSAECLRHVERERRVGGGNLLTRGQAASCALHPHCDRFRNSGSIARGSWPLGASDSCMSKNSPAFDWRDLGSHGEKRTRCRLAYITPSAGTRHRGLVTREQMRVRHGRLPAPMCETRPSAD